MKAITLYKFTRADGGITVSPQKPNGAYTTEKRLIADEGKILVNGDIKAYCVDVKSATGWKEIADEESEGE